MTVAGPSNEERVKVLFASCSGDLLDRAMSTASSIDPDLPLVVVSESAPPAGRWIQYRAAETFAWNLRHCRAGLRGRRVELALVMLQAQTAYRKLQAIAFLVPSRRVLAVNENFDYFEVCLKAAGAVLRHLRWRAREWRERRRRRRIRAANVPAAAVLRAQTAGLAIGLLKLCGPAPARTAPTLTKLPAGISVVIPSRNGKEMLARMLPAVLDQIEEGEILVVNNGFDDGSADFLRRHFPRVIVIDRAEPLAFAAAVNVGVGAARFSHVCLLNNDMAIAPGFLRHLRQAFEQVPDLFCAAAQVFLPAGQTRQETGKAFLRAAPAVSDFPVRCDLPIEGEDLTYVLYGSSGCSLYDAARLKSLRGLDEIYKPAYVEDLDVGVRAWQLGWPSVFVANAQVVHEHRATMSRLYSKEQLEYMVVHHWLLFLARTVRQRAIFARYWRHSIARLSAAAAGGSIEAKQVLGEIGVLGHWRSRRSRSVLPDAEIFALCGGAVAVFPGTRADLDQPVVVIVRLGLPEGGAAPAGPRQAMVALVDRLGPIRAELRERYVEIVTVQGEGLPEELNSTAFHAALRQTIRKWKPRVVRLQSPLLELYARDCVGLEITSEPCSRGLPAFR